MKLLTFFLFISHVLAMDGNYGDGKKSALALLEKDKNTATTFAVKEVPGFTTATPPEASLDETNINGSVAKAIPGNQAAQFIKQSSQTRPEFKIDAEKDPLFIESGKVADNPEATLKLQTHKQSPETKKTKYVCLKGQDLFEKKCLWTKVPKKTGVRKEVKQYKVNVSAVEAAQKGGICVSHLGNLAIQADPTRYARVSKIKGFKAVTPEEAVPAFKAIFHGRDELTKKVVAMEVENITAVKVLRHFGSLIKISTGEVTSIFTSEPNTRQYYEVEVQTFKEIPIYTLEDKNTCEALEAMADRGQCGYKSKRCIEGAETRMVEGTPVYADCWAEEAVFQCQGDFVDNCKHYLEKGCYQLSSKCKIPIGKTCVQWEQTFECIEKPGQSTGYRLTGKDKAYCLDGDCVDSAYVANNEMLQALSQMSILRQAEKDLRGNLSIFKGNDKRCGRSCIDFKDCCGGGHGWGVSLGLGQCGQDEVQLARERQEGKCVKVGTYCANRKLGVCIKKNTSFCCFNSRLSRLLQEHGKKQLKLSFGSAEKPECRGFTPQELSQLDFSKMDLSELFEDIQKNFKPQSAESITGSCSLKNLEQNMKNLTSGKK
jgi:type-F conjugative transfer system mating-pair stabilization protein TraN